MFRSMLLVPVAFGLAACGESPDRNKSGDTITVTNAQQAAPSGPAPAETRGQEFVSTVLSGYDFAIASAQMADAKADRSTVKRFAQMLRTDLAASRDQLKGIATAGGLTLAPATDPIHQTDLAILSSTRGAPLEQAFAEQQLKALTELVGLIRAYKNGGDNPQLKSWAETAQTVVNDRLLDLQSLNAELQEAAGAN